VLSLIEEMLELRLSGGDDAPSRARTAIGGLNGSLEGVAQPVRLLVSELVTNSVKHGAAGPEDAIELKLTASPEKVRVEVADNGPGIRPPARRDRPGGFGFMLVERLADRWGVLAERGTRVWFEIDRSRPTGAADS
jgi:two-component sensor histidine kinase